MPLFSPEKLQNDGKLQAPSQALELTKLLQGHPVSWEKPGPKTAATGISASEGPCYALWGDISQRGQKEILPTLLQ